MPLSFASRKGAKYTLSVAKPVLNGTRTYLVPKPLPPTLQDQETYSRAKVTKGIQIENLNVLKRF